MVDRRGPPVTSHVEIERLRAEAAGCTDCDLHRYASETVFGEGPSDAELMLIGEQPGDQEDRQGRPFVGPAGRILDRALEEASLDRADIYVTNAVKHFKFRRQGKVRLHQKPNAAEVAACRHWWEAEFDAVRPRLLVCLGAVAGQAVFGSTFRVTRERGTFVELPAGTWATSTIHPSAVLRSPPEQRDEFYAGFAADLRAAAEHLGAEA